jgi:hypothetical protein
MAVQLVRVRASESFRGHNGSGDPTCQTSFTRMRRLLPPRVYSHDFIAVDELEAWIYG